MPLTEAMRADLGLEPAGSGAAAAAVETALASLQETASAVARSAADLVAADRLRAVREAQGLAALEAIRAQTVRKPWDFAVARDANGLITAIRAIPEA